MRSLPSLLIVVLNKLTVQRLNGSWLNFNTLHSRTDWERERERESQRDCQSSLSSGEASYPQEGPEESYSYQHHHHDPPRKTNSRYLSTDTPVTTQYAVSSLSLSPFENTQLRLTYLLLKCFLFFNPHHYGG